MINRNEWNLSQIREIQEPLTKDLSALAFDLTQLAKKAVALGLSPYLAEHHNIVWLGGWVGVQERERARLEHARGIANARAGQITRKNFGV